MCRLTIREMLSSWDELDWNEGLSQRIVKALELWGADVEEALERFLYDEPLYLKSLFRFSQDGIFQKLEKDLEENNLRQAFELAHSMKGTAAILSLKPMIGRVVAVTEPLRCGQMPGERDVEELGNCYLSFVKLLEDEVSQEESPVSERIDHFLT